MSLRNLLMIVSIAGLSAACQQQSAPEPTEPATKAAAPAAAAEHHHQHQPKPVQPAPPPVCYDCGQVTSIEEVREAGEGSGAGAVAGAILGGVIGHQFGKGKGKDAATAGGAIAGGVAGHYGEKQIRAVTSYRVTVAMDDGSSRTVSVANAASLSVGTKVRVVGNDLQLR